MRTIIQVSARGSITLPKALRKALGIDSSGVIMAEESPDGILLRPAVAFPVEMYSNARVAEFDQADAALEKHLQRKEG